MECLGMEPVRHKASLLSRFGSWASNVGVDIGISFVADPLENNKLVQSLSPIVFNLQSNQSGRPH